MALTFDAPTAARLLAERGRTYRSTITVTAEPVTAETAWSATTGDVLTARAGDWWVFDGSDRWSVDADVFARTYEHLGGGRYRKTAAVTAVVLDQPFCVTTLEGEAAGQPGDYLVKNPDGDIWPVPAAVFESRYVAV